MLDLNIYLIRIGFLPFDFWDVVDILVVGVLLYQLYRLLRGSIALKIFVGIGLLLLSYQLFKVLGMDLLSEILFRFIEVGFISIIVIFQPEIRRFLLVLGNSTLRQRQAMINRLLGREDELVPGEMAPIHTEIESAIRRMARSRTGALLVFLQNEDPETFISGGTDINAEVSEGLLLSIFNKESPLHDGAVTIYQRRIKRASTILPVSENSDLPKSVGLRHRAAVGITEKTDVCCLIVSEETGKVSFTRSGVLERNISKERVAEILRQYV
ncbi:MAG: diadenylate cyclase CdaA [Bacteroidota bacterium]